MNLNRSSCLIVVVCLIVIPLRAQIPSGLIGWWRAENNLLDSVGTNNGVAVGDLLFGTGLAGSGFSLGGGGPGANPGGVRIPNSSTLQPNSTNLTVAAWVRAGACPGTFRYILSKSRTSAAASWGLYTAAPSGTGGTAPVGTVGAGFFVNCTNASSSFSVLAPLADETKLWDGTWHLLVGTFDRTACRLFVDGLEVGTGTLLTGSQTNAGIVLTNNFQNGDIVFGDFNSTSFGSLHYGGDLDEVMLFNRAITAQETLNLFTTFETNLVAWWQAEGNFKDSVGTNHGSQQGSLYIATGRSGKAFNITKGAVIVPDNIVLRPSSLTLAAQVRAPTPPTNKVIISKSFTSSISSYGLSTSPNGGLVFTVSIGGTSVVSPSSSTAIWDGQYHTAFGSYDGMAVRLYVDGIQVGFGSSAVGAIDYGTNYNNGTLFFGDFQQTPGAQNFSGGSIDEIKVFNRALSSQEVADRTPGALGSVVASVNPALALVSAGSYVTLNASAWQPWFVNNGGNTSLPLVYQWSKSGTNLIGLSGASLIFPSAQPAYAGQYAVEVSTPALSYTSDGHSGKAFQVNSEIRVPNGGDLSFSNSVSVQLWARASVPPGTFRYLLAKSFSSSQASFALYTGRSGTAAFYIKYASANTSTAISSQMTSAQIGQLWDGNWHQLTGTYSSTNGQARLFIDGVEFVSTNATSAPANSKIFNDTATYFQNGDIIIGDFSQYNGNFHFQGDLDEIKIIGRALSPGEILSSYTNAAPTNLPGTVLWLQGENNLTDSASNHTAFASPSGPSITLLSATLAFIPRLADPSVSNGLFQSSVLDADGNDCVVQKSSDGVNWFPLITNVAPFTFTDPTTENPSRLYRAFYQQ